jgi:hypothetical protein
MKRTLPPLVCAVTMVLLGACGQQAGTTRSAPSAVPTSVAALKMISPTYAPTIRPADFSTMIDNPYFPLVPGTRTIYEGMTADGLERNVVEVTRDTKVVMGVTTQVVHDVVSVDGKPEEETWDWYAQDTEGNVWYFGEDTRKLGGPAVDTSGSFEAGVDGAFPGIVMEAHPVVGDQYRQEYAKGEAEDTGEVLDLAHLACGNRARCRPCVSRRRVAVHVSPRTVPCVPGEIRTRRLRVQLGCPRSCRSVVDSPVNSSGSARACRSTGGGGSSTANLSKRDSAWFRRRDRSVLRQQDLVRGPRLSQGAATPCGSWLVGVSPLRHGERPRLPCECTTRVSTPAVPGLPRRQAPSPTTRRAPTVTRS